VAQNLEEFCRVGLGLSYRKMKEESDTLTALGEETYELIKALDIPRADVRLIAALPEDERESVSNALASADKGEVASLIHDLVDKLVAERAAAAEASADAKAAESVAAKNRALADEAEREAEKLRRSPAVIEREAEEAARAAGERKGGIIAARSAVRAERDRLIASAQSLKTAIDAWFDFDPSVDEGEGAIPLFDGLIGQVFDALQDAAAGFSHRRAVWNGQHGQKQPWEEWDGAVGADTIRPPDGNPGPEPEGNDDDNDESDND
jgi:hypothetical protein